MRLVALLQMTYVGAPMIFYGDEAGMWGADDPTNRQPMIWDDLGPYAKSDEVFVDAGHLAAYCAMTALRKQFSALRLGAVRTVLADDAQDLWVFERSLPDQTVLVALNASKSGAQFTLPEANGIWRCVYGDVDAGDDDAGDGDTDGATDVRVPSIAGRVWVLDSPH